MARKKIIVVGAGFGGISACKALAAAKDCEITLIDRRNHHLFQPLLYQVAMAGLNPADIAVPIRKIFSKQKNVQIRLGEVEGVDVDRNEITVGSVKYSFDYLILACGAKHFYFGNEKWEEFAPGLKNIEQATEIRRRILTAFELAENETDPEIQKSYLTFVIVGGGPTGVELAGSLAEMASRTLIKDYKRADLSKTKVVLVEAGDRVLPSFPEPLSEKTEKSLKKLGVEVRKNSMASDLTAEGLQINKKPFIAKTIVWAAGVKPSSLSETVSCEKDAQGRLKVSQDLSLPENKNVFVIGDQSASLDNKGMPLPGVAPVAIQQGKFVGKLIKEELAGKPRKSFSYFDKGIMATIGRSMAVVHTAGINIHGFLAWVIWVFIHIVYLMCFRNRLFVFLQWMWSYFSFGHGARIIVHKSWRFYDGDKIKYK